MQRTSDNTQRETYNAGLVQRFIDHVINGGRLDQLGEFIDPGHVTHCPDGDLYGVDGARLDIVELRAAFPDLWIDVTDLIADEDRVARQFTLRGTHLGPYLGIAPSGRAVEAAGMAVHRISDGRLAESWMLLDLIAIITRQRDVMQ